MQDTQNEKRWAKTLRFCLNKLVQIGFQCNDVAQAVVELLVESPWLIRNPQKLAEYLAIHEHSSHLEFLILHYADETDEMKEYMKSITLRAIGFLPHVSNILWQQVVDSSVSSSNVVSLMATETWLKVIQTQPELVEEEHLQWIEFALNKDPKPILRLRKNYLLILGEHGWNIFVDRDDDQDFLPDVYEIIRSNQIDSLFGYYEPEILTREFYSGYRSEYDGYYHSSSF